MEEIVIRFNHVTKMYKLFKNDKRRLLYTFCKKIRGGSVANDEFKTVKRKVNKKYDFSYFHVN